MRHTIAKREFLLAWMSSASVITVIRLLHATDLGYDPTLQLQAAQNLLAGKGLTYYWPASSDLAAPLTLETLTHFPAGYSLCAAALMAAGMDASTFVKLLGAIFTLLGWWGWGRLAFEFLAGVVQDRVWKLAAYWMAIVCPLLFTSRWAGTDIVLWAATPWIIRLITRPAQSDANRIRPDVVAGTVIGACILARYAGAFLLVYATLVIAAQSLRQRALALRRLCALFAGVLPFVAVQGYINHVVAAGAVAPGGVTMSRDMLAMASARMGASITTFAAANHGVFFWVPNSLRWWAANGGEPVGLVLACIVLLGLPLVLMTAFRDRISRWPDDIRIVAAGMLVGLPVFLWVCGLVGSYVYIRDVRYYEEIRPLAVCVALSAAAMSIASAQRRLAAAVWLSRAYVFAFVLMTAVEVTAAFTPSAAGATWRTAILGAEPRRWPSHQLTYESSEARRFVLALMNADPDAVLITTREQWFYADPLADRSRIMRWENCGSLRATHITGPVRFLILDAGRGDPGMRVQWPDVPSARRSCWPQMPGVELIRQFPEEGLRVLRADVSEGAHIRFKHRIPTSE